MFTFSLHKAKFSEASNNVRDLYSIILASGFSSYVPMRNMATKMMPNLVVLVIVD